MRVVCSYTYQASIYHAGSSKLTCAARPPAYYVMQIALFESLGRMLADVRAYVRRGRTRDVSGMLGKLVETANRVSAAISTHMQREEAEVLPLLAAALGSAEQRAIVWHTLR